jgi:hypothetical protein
MCRRLLAIIDSGVSQDLNNITNSNLIFLKFYFFNCIL